MLKASSGFCSCALVNPMRPCAETPQLESLKEKCEYE